MNDVFTLVGMRNVNFKGSDGNPVEGVNLFFTYEDTHIDGLGVEKLFIGNKRFCELSFMPVIGSQCSIRYNRYGKVADIVKA